MSSIQSETDYLDEINEAEFTLQILRDHINISQCVLNQTIDISETLNKEILAQSDALTHVVAAKDFYNRTPKFIKWIVNTFYK